MPADFPCLFTQLRRDTAGNVVALAAAAMLPLLGLVGGGIDIGRGYISQSRLQQACDAGVLAARKRLGANVAVSGEIPDGAAAAGERFFNLNFRNGAYGTENRDFTLTLESDYAVSGQASVDVPTTLMAVFGFDQIPVQVACQAQLNMSNLDVMMVLDTTGSMAQTNPGDSQPKISVLREVVKSFYAQLEANRAGNTRIRYGFVPYSSNINVGYLLKSDWVVDETSFPARVAFANGSSGSSSDGSVITPVSGTSTPLVPTTAASCPASTLVWTDNTVQTTSLGRQGRSTLNGIEYECALVPATGLYAVTGTQYVNYVIDWFVPNGSSGWSYENHTMDVTALNGATGGSLLLNGAPSTILAMTGLDDPLGLKRQFRGCIIERQTYEIGDYDNVDLDRAIDLDIDRLPEVDDPRTQWRPLFSEIFLLKTKAAKNVTDLDSLTANLSSMLVSSELLARPACPTAARKLAEMSADQIGAYVDSLQPSGSTYHDIGMLWGGRLLSPTGLFAGENADQPGRPTSRHMIFLTDGETFTNAGNYATYGLEAVERRRWRPNSPTSLNQTVENRFAFTCEEVKKKNVTVWVISFGTAGNPVMEACAGIEHYFVADDADGLSDVFASIAKRMGDLRMTR